MRERITSITVSVEDALIRFLTDAGRATDSRLDTNEISVIPAVVSGDLDHGFRSALFHSAVEDALPKFVPESRGFEAVVAKLVGVPSFPVPEDKFAKHDIEKISLGKPKCKNGL